MPVFRIDIIFANGKRFNEYRLVDGIELDTYYSRILRLAKRYPVPMKSFDVVQMSEHSLEVKTMRANNANRLSPQTQKPQPIPRMRYRGGRRF